jgi:UDP-N-acetylmuramoyl-L-alanyl-D-glutamate--2,6-diaminopimelate ligase
MTMPGRFANQKFLRRAVKEKCRYALMEMTSEGAVQNRHKYIEIDAMIFTNLSKEHIEAHGSFENYREAKLKLFKAFSDSEKENKVSIINADDKNAKYFAVFKADQMWFYGLDKSTDISDKVLKTLSVTDYKFTKYGMEFTLGGLDMKSKLFGKFNLYNILSAVSFARSQGIDWEIIKRAIEKFPGVRGRVEFVEEGQNFKIVVDYAHTPDSLEKLYKTFESQNKICVLGSAGGGRDKWKRSEMGRIASENCSELILTDEDPYDENPQDIARDIAKGIKSPFKYRIVLNRREAIKEALSKAKEGEIVLITGKGTDPYIMGPDGEKVRWDDAEVVRQELKKL